MSAVMLCRVMDAGATCEVRRVVGPAPRASWRVAGASVVTHIRCMTDIL